MPTGNHPLDQATEVALPTNQPKCRVKCKLSRSARRHTCEGASASSTINRAHLSYEIRGPCRRDGLHDDCNRPRRLPSAPRAAMLTLTTNLANSTTATTSMTRAPNGNPTAGPRGLPRTRGWADHKTRYRSDTVPSFSQQIALARTEGEATPIEKGRH